MTTEIWHKRLDAAVNIAKGILSEVEENHWPRRISVLCEAVIELAETYDKTYINKQNDELWPCGHQKSGDLNQHNCR